MTDKDTIERLEKEIAEIKHDIAQMRQDMQNAEILNAARNKKTDRVLTLLIGDEADEESGLFYRLKAMERFRKEVEKTKSYITGGISSAITIFVAIGGILAFIYKVADWLYQLFNHKP